MLTTAMPFHKYDCSERFSYILTFNNKEKFIKSPTSNGTYSVSDIQLEFENVNSFALYISDGGCWVRKKLISVIRHANQYISGISV